MKDKRIIFNCEKCGKEFSLPLKSIVVESIVLEKTNSKVKLKCIECDTLITITDAYAVYNLIELFFGL